MGSISMDEAGGDLSRVRIDRAGRRDADKEGWVEGGVRRL